MNERLYLGVEIGGTKLQVVLGNDHAAIIDRRRFAVDRAAGGAGIRKQIAQALDDYQHKHRISAIGIGFGGPVDWRTGKICLSHHIEGWSNFELSSWMKDLARVPVGVDNDANTAALAEAVAGAGKKSNPVFYVTLGSGVGGGLVVNKEIFHGAIPGEAEIGHVRLDRNGTILEKRCSGWAVDERIRQSVAAEQDSLLSKLVAASPGGESRHLAKGIESGDALAKKILNETAEDLAFGLSHVVHLTHPEMIILGGGLSLMGELLSNAVRKHLTGFIMDAFKPAPSIKIAALGEDVVPIGALLLAKRADA
ncbi:MAG TPA: ROK family protein [Candidatus Kapabacteria bacterium]|nr:ROK family protein [Candidatus Kapabacteria bacterium]